MLVLLKGGIYEFRRWNGLSFIEISSGIQKLLRQKHIQTPDTQTK
jgi:hypothetical protein